MDDAQDVHEMRKTLMAAIGETGKAANLAGYILRHEFYEDVLRMIARHESTEGNLARAALGEWEPKL